MSKSFSIAFLALLALFILLAGCLEQPSAEPEFLQGDESDPLDFVPVSESDAAVNPAPIPGNCGELDSQSGQEDCVFAEAVVEQDETKCSALPELWQRNNCVSAIARETSDTAICSQMESAFGSDNSNVKYSCIADVALGVFYLEQCSELESSSWETQCWQKAVGICNEIPLSDWKEVCLKKIAIESGSSENCLPLHGFERNTCLEEIAASYFDVEICSLIDDELIEQSCIERASKPDYLDQLE